MSELNQVQILQNYILDTFILTTHNKQKINLGLNYSEMSLFESIFSPFVFGSVVIVDNFNFITYGPIIGGEEIELIVKNIPSQEDAPKISTTFSVLSVETKVLEKNRTLVYQIKFCSKEAIYNQQLRYSTTFISKKYSQIASDIMEVLFTEIKKLSPKERKDTKERKKKEFIALNTLSSGGSEPSVSVHFPNLHPYDCMVYLMGKANTGQIGNPYFFYESFDRSFYFGSFKDHFYFDHTKGRRIDVNTVYEKSDKSKSNKIILFNSNQLSIISESAASAHAKSDFYAAIRNSFPKDFDFLENNKKGIYAHRLFRYDFTDKQIFKYDHSYKKNYSKIHHIYQEKDNALMVPEGPEEYKSPEYPGELIKTTFIHTQLFTGNNDFTPEITKNYRYLKLQELNNNYIQVNVPGDLSMTCGKFFDLYWNSPDVTTRDDIQSDPHVAGTYFCLRVRHSIKPDNFITSLELVQDSFMEKTLQKFPGKPDKISQNQS